MDHSADPKYDFDPPVSTVETPSGPPEPPTLQGLFAYLQGVRIARKDVPFYSYLVAAMVHCDPENREKLQAAWPDLWAEVQLRWKGPGGKLPSEMK